MKLSVATGLALFMVFATVAGGGMGYLYGSSSTRVPPETACFEKTKVITNHDTGWTSCDREDHILVERSLGLGFILVTCTCRNTSVLPWDGVIEEEDKTLPDGGTFLPPAVH